MSLIVIFSPPDFGGVLGRNKEKTPKAIDAPAAIFIGMYPNVMTSTINPDYSLTVFNASSTDLTLKIMSIVALIFVPIVLGYQTWSYWVFRKRVGPKDVTTSTH